jgi:subfamily B ATP-binding cassette protein MsbA
MAEPQKKKIRWSAAWGDARELVWTHRHRLLLGAVLMLINQAMGLVLPASTKFLIDQVIVKGRTDLLWKIALAAGAATVVQALTSFSLSQVLGVAAQRAITEMRKKVQAQIARLPVSYFDSTQVGKLISRIMNDAEGIRNLVGTGLVQLVGSFIHRSRGSVCFVLAQLASDLDHNSGAGRVRHRFVFRLHAAQALVPRAR